MLHILLKAQFARLLSAITCDRRTGKKRSPASTVLFGLLFLFLLGYAAAFSFLMASQLHQPLEEAKASWLYFALFAVAALALGIIGSVFTAYSTIYEAKDNDLLLAMPISSSTILLSRIASLYLTTFVLEALILVPAEIIGHTSSLQILTFTVLLFLLPLLTVAISCLLAGLIALAISKLANKNTVILTLSLLFMAGYLVVFFNIQRMLNSSVDALVHTVLNLHARPLALLGNACAGDWKAFGICAVLMLTVGGIVFYGLSKTFLHLGTANRGGRQKKARKHAYAVRSVGRALFGKEALRFRSSAIYLLNCGLGSLFLLIAACVLPWKGGQILSLTQMVPTWQSILPLLTAAAICMIASMNIVTAPSVSLEGKSIWILQSLPIPTWDIFRSKIRLQLIVTGIPALLLWLSASITLHLSVLDAFLVLLTCAAFLLLHAEMGLVFNLSFPNLQWINETVPIKQSMASFLSMFSGWIYLLVLALGYFALSETLSTTCYLLLAAPLSIVCALLAAVWLHRRGTRIWETLS